MDPIKLKDAKTMIGGSFPIPSIYQKGEMVRTAEKALIGAIILDTCIGINAFLTILMRILMPRLKSRQSKIIQSAGQTVFWRN